MPRRKTHVPLNVYLNGRLVGHLSKSSAGAIEFRYDETWLSWEFAMPVSLSLPLREDRYIGKSVTAVFENLLPDNDTIRRRLAERVKAEGRDAYSLLAAVGLDCVGALQFVKDSIEPGTTGQIQADRADEKRIADILKNLGTAPLGVTENEEFRISIAGAQEKTALLLQKGRWYIPHGTTPTTHILKPEIGKLDNGLDLSLSVENEHFCMRFLSALGLPAAQTEIHDFAGKRALVVERFDRRWARDGRLLRVPQEDCCQALSVPPTIKCQSDGGPGMYDILGLLKGSDDPERDHKTFLKAQICFWLLGATDGHAKNFSIFLNPGGRFHLTPLYDVMSAQPNVDAKRLQLNRFKLAMAVGENRHYVMRTILPRHFVQTAERGRISAETAKEILLELDRDVPKALQQTKAHLPREFPEKLVDSISRGVEARLEEVTSSLKQTHSKPVLS